MNNIRVKSFPDLGGAFQQLRIRDKLAEVSEKPAFGFAIQLALRNNKPNKEIFSFIWDQYCDNPRAVLEVIEESTIEDIRKLLKK